MPQTVHAQVLRRAAELLGGPEDLCRFLRVPAQTLNDWTQGAARVPTGVFLETVDLLAELRTLRFWDADFVAASGGRTLLEAALDAALKLTGADKGNVQLLDAQRGELRIEAQRGFEQPFLEFFACVRDERSACGAAMLQGHRVVVPDVAASAIFMGTPTLEVMLEAQALAVQSTPLMAGGRLLGVLSVHYRRPRRPSERDEHMIDLVVQRAARCLEQTPN